MAKDKRYYVYTLTDPRDGSVFYVGKGQGTRCFSHVRLAKSGSKDSNPRKVSRILEILAAGAEPVAEVVSYYEFEADAFEHERELIAAYVGLTNIQSGFGWRLTREECLRRSKEREKRILARENEKVRSKHFHKVVAWEAILKEMTRRGIRMHFPGYEGEDFHEMISGAVGSLADKWRRESGINLIGNIKKWE